MLMGHVIKEDQLPQYAKIRLVIRDHVERIDLAVTETQQQTNIPGP